MADLFGVLDAFVITSAQNTRHVRTLVEEIERELKELHGLAPVRVEGLPDATWVLMDYGDFIAHVFLQETREYYDLVVCIALIRPGPIVGGMRNHQDSKRKSEAVKSGKRREADRGYWPGGPAPDGLLKQPYMEGERLRHRLVEDPLRSPLVRRIFTICCLSCLQQCSASLHARQPWR